MEHSGEDGIRGRVSRESMSCDPSRKCVKDNIVGSESSRGYS